MTDWSKIDMIAKEIRTMTITESNLAQLIAAIQTCHFQANIFKAKIIGLEGIMKFKGQTQGLIESIELYKRRLDCFEKLNESLCDAALILQTIAKEDPR